MDRYPNHVFAASSAQHYVWLKQYYPTVFERVANYVQKGRFLPVGGAWLEHDCMLPSGESLVRQYLYGQRYFKDTFGVVSREAWLPDTFGYASQLPQILRLAGIEYFFTQKVGPPVSRRLTTALMEQHQHLPSFDLQLVRARWITGESR
jgi:alpha-mannosidase